MNNERLVILLTDILESSPQNPNAEWLYFDCPFCHHHKKKFAFNADTHAWKCWICQTRGISIFSLIRRLNKWHLKDRVQASIELIQKRVVKKSKDLISLPTEYRPLDGTKQFLLKRRVLKYLLNRGITKYQIQKYNIGFCQDGLYSNRIIIPSYNESNNLNYFVARSIDEQQNRKYLNPRCQKDKIIVFEHLINWNFPVILTEGIFDAITINFNSIPLLGKTLSTTLIQKLLYYDADIYVSLDNDARADQQKIIAKLASYGLDNIYYVYLKDKDPNEIGRMDYWNYLLKNAQKYSQKTDFEIMKNKVGKLFL